MSSSYIQSGSRAHQGDSLAPQSGLPAYQSGSPDAVHSSYGATQFSNGVMDFKDNSSKIIAANWKLPYRRRMNMHAITLSFLLPCFIFTVVSSVLAYRLRYDNPALAYTIVALCFLVVLSFGLVAANGLYNWRQGSSSDPSWHMFIFLTCLIAFVSGWALGDTIYNKYTKQYYMLGALATYGTPPGRFSGPGGLGCTGNGLNPLGTSGVEVMDAGAIYFCPGSSPDLTRWIMFKDERTFCAAPITIPSLDGLVYDFWAVGENCCRDKASTAGPAGFTCGEVNDPSAHAGLRIAGDDAYYRLAVQQAQMKYNLKSEHPLFFKWMRDPINGTSKTSMHDFRSGKTQSYWSWLTSFGGGQGYKAKMRSGMKLHRTGVMLFIIVQAILVLCASTAFWNLSAQLALEQAPAREP